MEYFKGWWVFAILFVLVIISIVQQWIVLQIILLGLLGIGAMLHYVFVKKELPFGREALLDRWMWKLIIVIILALIYTIITKLILS